MINQNINPTRMELMRLKARLKTTMRGHKLLKDRADEMIRQFIQLINQNRELRKTVELDTIAALRAFSLAQTMMTTQEIETALALPALRSEINADTTSLMGIDVPKLELQYISKDTRTQSESQPDLRKMPSFKQKTGESRDLFPYSFSSTVSELDDSVIKMSSALKDLIKLAELEKTCDILADEIEKIRRRVNALEQFVIPQIRAQMKSIVMKLDENERSNLVRLMKVKEIISEDF